MNIDIGPRRSETVCALFPQPGMFLYMNIDIVPSRSEAVCALFCQSVCFYIFIFEYRYSAKPLEKCKRAVS